MKRLLMCLGIVLLAGAWVACSGRGPGSTENPPGEPAGQDTPSPADQSTTPDASTTPDTGSPTDAIPTPDAKPQDKAPTGDDSAIAAIKKFIDEQSIDKNKAGWRTQLSKPPQLTFTAGRKYYWLLKTNVGNVKVLFKPDVAPMHVSSTIYLTTLGFYDTLKFHRVITNFMAQGGDPLGTGTGGPGYNYAGEISSSVKHDKPGLLSMANAGPNTDGSQFFLTFVATPWLDGKHTIFGEVVEGMDTLKALESAGSTGGTTSKALFIESATISVE